MPNTAIRSARRPWEVFAALTAVFALSLACSQTAGKSETPTSTGKPDKRPTPSSVLIGTDQSVPGAGAAATEALSKSFPLPPGAEIDQESVSEDDPGRGSFTLRSNGTTNALADFYAVTLPALQWIPRYTDANTDGGVTQFWKKGGTYLSIQFGYNAAGAFGKVKYQTPGADALAKLPSDFPVPDKSELIEALNTSWDFYVDQEFAAVTSFYEKASAEWGPCAGYGAEGEGDDGGGRSFPAGITPMPSPTRDSRAPKDLCWVLPSLNQVELFILPHGDATLLHVYVTSLNPSDANLPADIPIYPGAAIQSSDPGMVTFQAGASLQTVRDFYKTKLAAAGWTLDGQPIESEGAVIMNWKKGNQTVMISITALGADDCLVMIAYEES
jgi:hypothetical protein